MHSSLDESQQTLSRAMWHKPALRGGALLVRDSPSDSTLICRDAEKVDMLRKKMQAAEAW